MDERLEFALQGVGRWKFRNKNSISEIEFVNEKPYGRVGYFRDERILLVLKDSARITISDIMELEELTECTAYINARGILLEEVEK